VVDPSEINLNGSSNAAFAHRNRIRTDFANPHYEYTNSLDHVIRLSAEENMPSRMGRSASLHLERATVPYIKKLLSGNLRDVILGNKTLRTGVNTFDGHVTNKAVAEKFGVEYRTIEELLGA